MFDVTITALENLYNALHAFGVESEEYHLALEFVSLVSELGEIKTVCPFAKP